MANFSWKIPVSVLRISLTSCRSSENKLHGTQQTNEQIASVLILPFDKMQAWFLKKNFFISFGSKFFEKCFNITCILPQVCATIQRSNLKKGKSFFFSNSSETWAKKIVNWNKIAARLSKVHFPCPKEQFEKDI